MRRVNRRVRALNNFGDYIVSDIERAGLLSTWTDILYLKRRAEQSSIAQNDFGCALPDDGELRRRSAEFEREGEGLSITECHIFAPFLPKLSSSLPELSGNQDSEITIVSRVSSVCRNAGLEA